MKSISARIFWVWFLSLSAVAAAAPRRLDNLPTSREARGDAFVDAWTAFRGDLDTLAQLDVHPALFDQWLDSMPEFLLRDAARLATEPKVVLAAASRLAAIGGAANRELLEQLGESHRDTDAGMMLRALAITAGDHKERRAALDALENPSEIVRINAAQILSMAGEERGRAFLRSVVKRGREEADTAARILGRLGRDSDVALLARAGRVDPTNDAFPAAVGELEFKKLFPYHYRAFLLRYPDPTETGGRNGIYETWFLAINHAVDSGARTAADALRAFQGKKIPLRSGIDQEVQNRHLSALESFWRSVDAQLGATGSVPNWPTDFSSAMRTIGASAGRGEKSAEQSAAKIAAELSVLSSLGGQLDWARFAIPTQGVLVLTPGAGRAADGNMATSWCANKGDRLELETDDESSASAILIMNRCPLNDRAKITAVRVAGDGAETKWSLEKRLEAETGYFERIVLPGKKARRFSVDILDTRNGEPACIAEIRLE